MKTLLKIFFVCALLAPALEANAQDVNTRTRQLRFYPVRAASDTAAIAGNSGRMWYDFVSNQFRGNVGGTNFTFGSGGSGGDMILSATQTNTGIKTFDYINPASNAGFSTFRLGRNTVMPAGSVAGDVFMSEGLTTRGLYFNNDNVYGLVYRLDTTLPNVGTIPFFTGAENGLMNTNNSFTFNSSVLNVPGKGQFTGSTARAGINLGGFAGDVSSPTNADMWYNLTTNNFRGRIGGASDSFAFLAASQTFTNKTLSTGTVFSSAPTINDGLKFTFNPNGTNAGLNFGAHTANPSSPVNGDAYYNSTTNQLFAYINGAWVALGSGGGFTNGAANNELIKSDGTNGVSSGIFAVGNADLNFGSVSTGSEFRDLTAVGSEANITFRYNPKGVGGHVFTGGNFFVNTSQAAFTSTHQIGVEPSSKRITFTRLTDTPSTWTMRGSTGTAGNNNGDDFTISGGHAFLSGTGNGGNLILEGGSENSGSGSPGNVYTRYEGELINLALFEPVQETGTSFTFDYSHLSKLVVGTNAATITATVPVLQVGYITKVVQDGAGVMNLSAGTNVVLVGKTSTSFIGDTIVIHAYKTSGSDTYYLCE